MSEVWVKAPGKINLSLDIVGKRRDGYHDMRMVMQAVELADTLVIAPGKGPGVCVTCSDPRVPCGEKNLAARAAKAFLADQGLEGESLSIHIQKRIPMEAGMAGGSADAAGTLVGLCRYFGRELSRDALCALGVSLGADVPFCIGGGTQLSEGIGERLTPLPPLPECCILLAKPEAGIKTKDSFARFDAITPRRRPNTDAMVAAVSAGDLSGVGKELANVFEEVTDLPELAAFQKVMGEYGALGSVMTGTGTVVFGLFDDPRLARRCARSLFGKAGSVFLTRPDPAGARVEK
ncbi:MAG: 4-(cytidine 5'-diphospho)-2-C-methyl-D-erythritol kinase [Oscillospiraceae bacterium]|nr:4-(cytidine 5'-diphospho)-2-C-methyl-D-erythritol kinase [Oscillospiraceae bacterium]